MIPITSADEPGSLVGIIEPVVVIACHISMINVSEKLSLSLLGLYLRLAFKRWHNVAPSASMSGFADDPCKRWARAVPSTEKIPASYLLFERSSPVKVCPFLVFALF